VGSGYKTFTAGEVLTASSVQNFLQNQTVMSFAGSAARSSAIGTANFEEGMTSYLQDTNLVEVYNGTNWASIAPSGPTPGLVQIGTAISFSGVSSVSAPANTFTSTYSNYRILFYCSNSADSVITRFRVRAAGTDLTTGTYRYVTNYGNSAGDTVSILERSNTGTSAGISYQGVRGSGVQLDIFRPQLADYTHITSTSTFSDATNVFWLISTGFVNNTTSYDSFTIFPSANNMTGVMSVYGYNA
jgi:hypothetical protein